MWSSFSLIIIILITLLVLASKDGSTCDQKEPRVKQPTLGFIDSHPNSSWKPHTASACLVGIFWEASISHTVWDSFGRGACVDGLKHNYSPSMQQMDTGTDRGKKKKNSSELSYSDIFSQALITIFSTGSVFKFERVRLKKFSINCIPTAQPLLEYVSYEKHSNFLWSCISHNRGCRVKETFSNLKHNVDFLIFLKK